jgi:hypothetical protein
MRIVLVLGLAAILVAGCGLLHRPFDPARDLLPVGTCVLASDRGETVVPCTEPHTHKVVAIAPRAEACPPETAMFASPADPHDGSVTACYVRVGPDISE